MLDDLIPVPRKLEIGSVDLSAPPSDVWKYVRHGDLAESPLVRALFALRTLPSRLRGAPIERGEIRIDDLRSTPERPGFQILAEDPERELAVGAIGKAWQLDIPFVHVADEAAYRAFEEPGWVKVAWAVRLEPLGDAWSRLFVEVRVDATDDAAWTRFERYWHVVGPGSHFIRHALFAQLREHFGALGAHQDARSLPGDELLGDAQAQITHGITIRAAPAAIWPWLVQMGCRRGGFYSIDALDNGGVPSAREIRPELQQLAVGDVIPATPDGDDGFEVLAIEPERVLVLGGLFDPSAIEQLPFASARPKRFWQVTWAFVLERLNESSTRLHVRARAAFSRSERLHTAWIRPVHALMQSTQLRHLAARAEGRIAREERDDARSSEVGG